MTEIISSYQKGLPKVRVIGIPLFSGRLNEITEHTLAICTGNNNKENRCISATSVHGLVYSNKNKIFRKILRNFYCNIPDGKPGVWIGRIKGSQTMRQCTGPDYFEKVIHHSSNKKINHYFCGGKSGVAESLKDACRIKFKNSSIVGTFSPPFREMTDEELRELGKEINKSQADIVWVGLSTPKQEIFASRLAKFTHVHFIVTVGAAFDFHSGNLKKAPKMIKMIGFEWFYRLCLEPTRLIKRYAEIVPLYFYYNVKEFLLFLYNNKGDTKDGIS